MNTIGANLIFDNFQNLDIYFEGECEFSINDFSYKIMSTDETLNFTNPNSEGAPKITSIRNIPLPNNLNLNLIDVFHGELKCKTCSDGNTYCVEKGAACIETPCGRLCYH